LAYLRCIPNMIIYSLNEIDCKTYCIPPNLAWTNPIKYIPRGRRSSRLAIKNFGNYEKLKLCYLKTRNWNCCFIEWPDRKNVTMALV
jgi:hypothetical protein